MARPKKDADIDLSEAHELTAGLIERLTCPDGKQQVFLRDAKVPGLRVRVTAAGAKSFVFEAKLKRQTIRRTIGSVKVWAIDAPDDDKDAKSARREARLLAVMLDTGTDPRELERQQNATKAANLAAANAQAVTVGDVWPRFLVEGKPKRKDAFKPRYRADLEAMAAPGGEKKKRGEGNTRPGPLFPLLALPLSHVNEDTLKIWFDRQALTGKHQAARALMMFRGFMRWCSLKKEYRALIDRTAGSAPAILENLPKKSQRTDALQMAQIKGWWAGVEQLDNRTASVYLRALLLTGARREEIAALTWDKVDFKWRKLTIADKVDATRTIPLTPYLAQLLATLPRTNAFVFAAASKSGHIADARASHSKVLRAVQIEHLTFHGLRRTFTQRGRAAAPAGAVGQMQGHKPSATADGYDILFIDDLRPYAERIEAYILEQAGVSFDPKAAPGALRVVAG